MSGFLEPELRRHSAALRALARSLVGAQDADDLVQDTSLQALRQPPRQPEGLRPWLVRVLRFRAGKLRRGEQRRLRREEQTATPEPPSTPHALAERMETLTRLHDALRELAEPYRGTLLQRFFEDLTPTEIATRTDTPLATVKSRLQRGLDLLRTRLATGTRDWRESLAVAFGLPASATTITTTAAAVGGGGVLMTSKLKLVGGTVAATVAAAGWWLAPAVSGGRGTPDTAAPASAPVLAALPARPDHAARTNQDTAAEGAREAALPPPPSTPSVQVRVLAADGTAAPDVEVFHLLSPDRLRDLDSAGKARLALVAHDNEALLQAFGTSVRSDARGIARWPHLDIVRSWWIVGARHGNAYGEVHVNTQQAADEVTDLRLAPSRSLTMSLQDADRQPVAGVMIVGDFAPDASDTRRVRQPLARTDERGIAVAHNLQTWHERVPPRGAARPIHVRPDLPGVEDRLEVDLVSPPQQPVQLTLPPTGGIEVRVFAASGDAAVGTTVRLVDVPVGATAPSWSTTTDAGGVAAFPRVGLQRRWRVTCDGATPLTRECEGPRSPGEVTRVELRPDPVPILTGRLLQADAPLARTRFHLVVDGRLVSHQPSETDDDGRFRVVCAAPFAPDLSTHRITCTRLDARNQDAGWIAVWSGSLAGKPEPVDLGDLEFVEVPIVIAGRLVAGNDQPIDETVTLWVEAATGTPDAPWQHVALRSQRQADGTFTCRGTAPAGALRLCVWTRNRYLPVPPLTFSAPARDVVVPLRTGGSVRASMLLQSPEQMWCTTPLLVPEQPQMEPPLFARYGQELDPAVPLHTDVVREREGELEVACTWPAVAPGRYRLQVRTRNVTAPLLEVPAVVVVDGVRTEEPRLQRLRLPDVRVVRLAIPQAREVLAAGGRPPTAGAGTAFVLDGDTPTDQCMQIDSDFVLFASPRPLDVLVRLHGHHDLVVRGVYENRTLQLAPGIPCTLTVTTSPLPAGGRLDLTMTAIDDTMAAARPWVYSPAAGGSLGSLPRYEAPAATQPSRDGAASFALPRAGRYRVTATWTDADRGTTPAVISPAEILVGPTGGAFSVTAHRPQ